MEKSSRTLRELESRDSEKRPESWRPPSLLPSPLPRSGVKFRWIRTSTLGHEDNKNVSQRFRENWVPVKASDVPELQIRSDRNSTFPEGVEVGGLLLCMTADENVESRKEYYDSMTRTQLESVDNAFLRQNDPRMPLLKPERRTRVSKGNAGSE